MLFVIHATDKKDGMPTRAKFYRAHRTHLDHATAEGVHVLTAGPLVADDAETPIGSRSSSRPRIAPPWRPSAASIRTASTACGRQSKSTPSSAGAGDQCRRHDQLLRCHDRRH